ESSVTEASSEASAESSAEEPAEPIAITGAVISTGCQYEVPGGKGYVVQDDKWPANYTADLTDGVAATHFDYDDDSWFAFSTNKNADKTTGLATVTLPLDKVYNVTSLRLHLGNFSGVKVPNSVKAYARIDSEYKNVGSFPLQSTEETAYWTELKLAGLNTDSIKLEFVLDGMTAFINEVEVHGGDPIQVDNIALRKNYTIKGLYPGASNATYPDEDGITMTDGYSPASNATYQDKGFIGMNVSTDEYKANGYGSITVDLEKSHKVDKFVANVASSLNSAAGIKAPSNVSVYVSDDNTNWTKAGEVTPTDSTTIGVVSATVLLDEAVDARYVQFRFVGSSNWIFVSEVEVYGEHIPSKGEILSKGKQYTTTPSNRTDNRVDDGIRLTDGVKGTKDGSGPEYAGWDKIHDNGVDVIIDLGKSYYSDTYTAYYAGGKWGLASPKEYESIDVYVSDTLDGEYKLVASAKIGDAVLTNGTGASDETWSTYTLTATAENSVKGRYVKFHFMHSQEHPAMLWIDEVEVSQNKEPATEPENPTPDNPNPEPDEPTEPDYMLGDVNDDKKVDSVDYLLVKRACFKTYTLSQEEELRANINKDNTIDSTDYLLVKRIAFGTYTVA
ncbi:MAG: discoidin domain-containing protein, partial [Clostridia bacterium]|nr:discoidin domain-containing protein [Clostridia bacterium]